MPLSSIPSTAKIALTFRRSRAPLASDDAGAGYAAGTIWINDATGDAYLCTSAISGQAIWSLIQATTPPPGDQLTWAPPTLAAGSGTVNYTLTDANRGSIPAGAGRDLKITQAGIITTGGGNPAVPIDGYRHVIWIGGEFQVNSGYPTTCIAPRNCTGTLHFEGIEINGTGVGDALTPRLGNAQTYQIQNCRFRVSTQGGFHADTFQLQGTRISNLRFDKCTFVTDYQGHFLQNEYGIDSGAYCTNLTYKRVNFVGFNAGTVHFIFQVFTEGDSTAANRLVAPITLVNDGTMDTVWIDGGPRPVAQAAYWVHPNPAFQDPFSGVNFAVRRGSFLGSDADGSYVYFSTGGETVPAGGATSGQATLDCHVSGKLRVGTPPAGDWCPASIPGLGYVSPGYL